MVNKEIIFQIDLRSGENASDLIRKGLRERGIRYVSTRYNDIAINIDKDGKYYKVDYIENGKVIVDRRAVYKPGADGIFERVYR